MKAEQLLDTLSNCLTIDTASGNLYIYGNLQQGAVKSALLYANAEGKIIAAPDGIGVGGGGLTEVGIDDLTATGVPSNTTYLRGDNTWATLNYQPLDADLTAIANLADSSGLLRKVDSSPSWVIDSAEYMTIDASDARYQVISSRRNSLVANNTSLYYSVTAVNNALGDKMDIAGGTFTGNLTINSSEPSLILNDSSSGGVYRFMVDGGQLYLKYGTTSPTTLFTINSTGGITFESTVTSVGFKVPDGTAAQFLKANGTIDSTVYQPLDADLTTIAGLADSSGLLRKVDATPSWIIDTEEYMTIAASDARYVAKSSKRDSLVANNTSLYYSVTAVNNALADKMGIDGGTFAGNLIVESSEPSLILNDTSSGGVYRFMVDGGQFYLKYGTTSPTTLLTSNSSGAFTLASSVTATSFIKSGGTSSQFLKADGSVDSSAYVTSTALSGYLTAATAATTYQPLNDNLTAITGFGTGTGILKKINDYGWALDTETYLTSADLSNYQLKANLSTNLTASSTKYPSVNAVNTGLGLKLNLAGGTLSGGLTLTYSVPTISLNDDSAGVIWNILNDGSTFKLNNGATNKFYIFSNGNAEFANNLTASAFVKSGGTSSQYLMADGSVSTNPGWITGYTETDTFGSVVSRGSTASSGTAYGLTLTHTYSQTSIYHNTLFLKATNSGAELGASIGFTVVNAAGDHHRAIVKVTGNTGNAGGQYSIYTRRGSDNANIEGYYQDENGNVKMPNYVGIGQDINTGYRLIVSGSMYLNANGNGWAEGTWKQRRGGSTFYDVIDAGNIGAQSVNYATNSDYSNLVAIPDWRDTSYTPNQYAGNRVGWHFNNTGQNGSPAGDYWGAMQTVSPWGEFNTSHRQMQLWWGGSAGLSYRYAVGSGYTPTGWSGWERILTSSNFSSWALPLSGGTLSGTLTLTSSWGNAGGDYTGITNPSYKVAPTSSYWRVVYLSNNGNVSGVYNYESGKNVYWGEPTDTGGYYFRGRNLYITESNGTDRAVIHAGNIGSQSVAQANQLFLRTASATAYNANTADLGVFSNYYGGGSISNVPDSNYGSLYTFGGYNNTSLSLQLYSTINHNSTSSTRTLYFRMGNNLGFQNDWHTILDASNYPYAASMNQHVRQGDDVTHAIVRASNYMVSKTIYSGGGNLIAGNNLEVPSGDRGFETSASGGVSLYSNEINAGAQGGTGQLYLAWRRTTQINLGATLSSSSLIYTSNQGSFGPDSGGDNGIRVNYGNEVGGYGRIRFYQSGSNHSTIHSFSSSWQNGNVTVSTGCINITGSIGVTFGAWNVPDFYVPNGGSGWFRYNVTAAAFYESSDIRLKVLKEDDINILGIENLKAKLYTKKGKLEYGYFAQEAEKYMPTTVSVGEDGYLNLSYREVHTAKIARLEKRVAELEKQLNSV